MEILKKIILENQQYISSKKLVHRNIYIPRTPNIIILTGIRRSGKTSILYLEAQKHIIEDILFLDFEDERLLFLNNLEGYDEIIDSYSELYPNKRPILFFDEIQGLKNWHLYIKRLYAKEYKIFITGSNANLLSGEIATYITGRGIEISVNPFSFPEFLSLKKIGFSQKDLLLSAPVLKNSFREYLQFGGFPEAILADDKAKRLVLQNIFSLVFYKDLVARFDKKEVLMKHTLLKLAENVTKPFTIGNLANKINTLYKTSRQTLNDYLAILHLPFFIESIHVFRKSVITREIQRKTYFVDNGFITLLSLQDDLGKLLENTVYNHLKRRYEAVYYYKTRNGLEVDFLTTQNGRMEIFQVSYNIDDNLTFERETTALFKAMDELNLKKSFLITADKKSTLEKNGKKISIIPFWEWSVNITNYLTS